MTDTLFPADGSTQRHPSGDPLEPLARLEDQLRRSRERLVDGADAEADPADAIPAVLATPEVATAEAPSAAVEGVDGPAGAEAGLPDIEIPRFEVEIPEIAIPAALATPELDAEIEVPAVTTPEIEAEAKAEAEAEEARPPAPSPYAALAELTPVNDFVFEPDAPLTPEQDVEDGFVVVPLLDLPEPEYVIPEIAAVDLPEPILLGEPLRASEPDAPVVAVAEEDDVWQPFPEVRSDAAVPAVEAAAGTAAAVPEQDPLPVPARATVPVPEGDTERAIADAAREVSWLARRVADGLESMTGRLDAFERQLAELADRPAAAAPQAAPAPEAAWTDPTALEEWSMALARLVRADSTALRDEVHRIAEEQDVALAEVHRLTEENGARISASVEETIARIDTAVLRLADAIDARLGSAVASLEAAADAMRSEDQEALVRLIDDRMEALARLVRSDNERISARLEAEIGIGREVLRAAKELQASLADDVASALDQRDRMFRASHPR